MTKIDPKIIRKWDPLVEQLGYHTNNRVLFEHICNYCEWCSIINYHLEDGGIPSRLNEIRQRTANSKRVAIVRNVFNIFTGIEEYELSNGRYVPVNSSFYYEFSTDELVELFGLEYMKFFDPIEFRDKQIDKIIL